MIILGEHFNRFVSIFLLVNSVVSGEADQSALIKNPRQALSIIMQRGVVAEKKYDGPMLASQAGSLLVDTIEFSLNRTGFQWIQGNW